MPPNQSSAPANQSRATTLRGALGNLGPNQSYANPVQAAAAGQVGKGGIRLGGSSGGRGGQSTQSAFDAETARRQREQAEAAAKAAAEAEAARQARIQSQTLGGQLSSGAKSQGYGSFISEEGFQKGFVTSTGRFYPTSNAAFVPQGFAVGSISGFNPRTGSFILTQSSGTTDAPPSGVGFSTNSYDVSVGPIGSKTIAGTTRQDLAPRFNTNVAGPGVVTRAPQSDLFFGRVQERLTTYSRGAQTRELTGGNVGIGESTLRVGAGALGVGAGFVAFGESLFRAPVRTVTSTVTGVASIGGRVISGEGFPTLGTALRTPTLAGAGRVIGEVGLAAGPLVISKGVRAAESALGLPRYDTRFLGTASPVEDALRVQAGAVTTRRGLFTNRQFISGTFTEVTPFDENLFSSSTAGVIREVKGFDLIRGRNVIGKSKPFAAGDITESIPSSADLLVQTTPFQVRKEIEGFKQTSLGITANSKGTIQSRIGLGFSTRNEDIITFYGREAPISRGRVQLSVTDSRGIIRLTSPLDDSSFIGSGFSGVRTVSNRAVFSPEQTIEKAIERQLQSSNLGTVQSTTASIAITRSASIYAGTGLYERTETQTFQLPKAIQRQDLFSRSSLGQFERLGNRSGTALIQLPRQRDRLATSFGSSLFQGTAQTPGLGLTQAQVSRSGQGFGRGFGSVTPSFPSFPLVPYVPVPRNSLFLSTRPGRSSSLLGSFSPRYAPSLTATTFNIRGVLPKRFKSGNVDPFSTRVIPTTRRKRRRK